MLNQVGSRLVFENAKTFVQSQGFDTSHAVLTQGYLRSEVAMSISSAQYHVPVLVNDSTNGSPFATEQRLALQDIFVVSAIGVFVAAPSSSTATAFPLLSYPNATTFSTSGAAAALYNLYNGSLNITVNNQQILPTWDLFRHYFVPQTQNGVGASTGATLPIDQIDASENAFGATEPNILLNGASNIQANITLPGAIGTLQASTSPRIVVIWRGIKCQNVTSVR
jgi:hypothetical protein